MKRDTICFDTLPEAIEYYTSRDWVVVEKDELCAILSKYENGVKCGETIINVESPEDVIAEQLGG